MDKCTTKKLILSTAEEYKHTLGGDFKVVFKELNRLEITKISSDIKENIVGSTFNLKIEKYEFKIFLKAKKEFLLEDEILFSKENSISDKFIRMTILVFWLDAKRRSEIFEYYIDLCLEKEEYSKFKKDEFHKIYVENCEQMRELVLPSCDLISFFDIFLLSLVRSTTPLLTNHLNWKEAEMSFRNSLTEQIAAEECSDTQSEENYSDSDSGVESVLKKINKS